MFEFIVNVMDMFGYFGIIFLIAIENLFPPIPSEVILTFAGFMTTCTSMNILGVVFFASAGSMIGAYCLYFLGFFLSPEKMKGFVNSKVGRLLGLKPENIDSAQNWFNKKGKLTVLFCRFIPIVRSLISIPAGMAHMDLLSFSLLTLLGSIIWNVVLVSLGAIAGASWPVITMYFSRYSFIGKLILGLAVLYFVFCWLKKKEEIVTEL